ncbi:TonB-dependent receptor [Pseudoxanthomonas composti]|uniref:TonB-dependent receptor n=1 Tax=Pseudoxanthomonas composti TaxID=2137479 RepID=A0A4Q1JXF5_9GAMM|nr:TonB-dependent receptor [Pseudoxanthomonas composti]RXR06339.1 TonB-dependent receptor [Pseudoxanthomonas composti]
MRIARRSTLFLAVGACLLAPITALAQAASPVPPQESPTSAQSGAPAGQEAQTLDAVSVVGIRGSLEAARDIKRDSAQIVDAIVADDIGKLPDTNVAESLARVAGVQLERGMGEGSDILVRGLKENVILYNGRQIVDATGRGGNGLDQLATSTYGLLSLVPSELISRLSVTKLAGADQIAGGLGGIVDINTRQPLDGDVSQNVLSLAGVYNELPDKLGGNAFGLLSTRNEDRTFGALLSATYGRRQVMQQGLDTFSGYARYTDAGGQTRFGSTDMRAQNIDDDREKTGVSAVLQWRPADGVEITADTFYARQEAERDRYWVAFNPAAGLSNATYSDHDILLAGRSSGTVLLNTEVADIDSDTWSSALRAKFRIGERLDGSVEANLGKSTASYHQRYMRLAPMAGITSVTDFDLRSGSFGSFNVSGVDVTDPAQWRMTIMFDNDWRAQTDSKALRTDWNLAFDQSAFTTLDFGARFNRMESRQDPLRADIRPAGGLPATQLADYLRVWSNPDFLPGEFAGLPRAYLGAYRAQFGGCGSFTTVPVISQNAQCLDPRNNALAYAATFGVDEDFLEAYTKLNWDTTLGELGFSGNVGVRMVDRDLESRGNLLSASGAAQPSLFTRSDREFLPSAVAKLQLSDTLVLRGGAAKVVAFPNTEDLNNGVTLNNNAVFDTNGTQISPGTGSGGAPDLDPFKATQYDLSLEWYYGGQGLLSMGLFYKDVSTFIVQRQSAETYNGTNYLVLRKVNGDSATVRGAELLAQVPFTGMLDGFGMVATYTWIDSETPIRDVNGNALTFPGLSKNNVNLIGYYENGPFGVRVAYNWRDEYLMGLSAAATGIYNDTYKDLSASFSYDFGSDLSLKLECTNLLDSEQRTYDGYQEGLRTNVVFGRTYQALLTYRF